MEGWYASARSDCDHLWAAYKHLCQDMIVFSSHEVALSADHLLQVSLTRPPRSRFRNDAESSLTLPATTLCVYPTTSQPGNALRGKDSARGKLYRAKYCGRVDLVYTILGGQSVRSRYLCRPDCSIGINLVD